jgi:hypothetical protein
MFLPVIRSAFASSQLLADTSSKENGILTLKNLDHEVHAMLSNEVSRRASLNQGVKNMLITAPMKQTYLAKL